MTKTVKLGYQLSREKILNLIFFLAVELVGIVILKVFFATSAIGQLLLQLTPVFMIIGFTIKAMEINEKVFTKSIWRSLPVSNRRLYFVNLVTSIIPMILFMMIQAVFIQLILKTTHVDYHFFSLDITSYHLKTAIEQIATLMDTFATISLIHLCYLGLKYYNNKINAGLAKFASIVFVLLILIAISYYGEMFAVKFIFHSQQDLDQSMLYLIVTVVLEIVAGIYLMTYAEVKEVSERS